MGNTAAVVVKHLNKLRVVRLVSKNINYNKSFIMSVQYIWYLVPYRDKVQRQVDNN